MKPIFAEVNRDLRRMFYGTGTLPDQNISVALVDGSRLLKLHRDANVSVSQYRTLGLTCSRKIGARHCEHSIFLLDGLGPARLAAVAAHEWAHTWLFENLPANRSLKQDAVEGFCELVAYRLMGQRQEEIERQVILANTYTAGQFNLLAETVTEAQFLRVVDWMKSGTEPLFDQANSERLLTRNPVRSFASLWRPTVKTPVPSTLKLKGISGTTRHRFALVNNRTLEKNETGTVRMGNTNVVVRCLDIRDHSVLLEVTGQSSPLELFLAPTSRSDRH